MSYDPFVTPEPSRPEGQTPPSTQDWQPLVSPAAPEAPGQPAEPAYGYPGAVPPASGAPGYPEPTPYAPPASYADQGRYGAPAPYPGPAAQAPAPTTYGATPATYGATPYGAAQYGAPQNGVPQYGATPYGPPPYVVNSAVRGSYRGIAIASFVTAVAALVLVLIPGVSTVLAILGVVFGHVSISQFRRDSQPRAGHGLAVAGLVIGYVGVVASVAIWVAFAAYAATLS